MKKVLIAYDGSMPANAALLDLAAAGLPEQIEACVLVVAEQWLPTPHSFGLVDLHLAEGSPSLAEQTERLAATAVNQLKTRFPAWAIQSHKAFGSPAREIIAFADDWQPNLICLGSHGHSTFERFLLGSVSHKIAHSAHCSVRIARGHLDEPDDQLRLVIGFDATVGSEAAIEAVAQRPWPAGTEVRLVTADFAVPPSSGGHPHNALLQWVEDERARIRTALATAVKTLKEKGLIVSSLIKDERPNALILEVAKQWGADCIFVGANQLGRIDRFLLGSVSTSVAMNAHCSVEIVRPSPEVI